MRAAAIEILSRLADPVIGVAGKMIGQKPNPLLEDDDLRANDQRLAYSCSVRKLPRPPGTLAAPPSNKLEVHTSPATDRVHLLLPRRSSSAPCRRNRMQPVPASRYRDRLRRSLRRSRSSSSTLFNFVSLCVTRSGSSALTSARGYRLPRNRKRNLLRASAQRPAASSAITRSSAAKPL